MENNDRTIKQIKNRLQHIHIRSEGTNIPVRITDQFDAADLRDIEVFQNKHNMELIKIFPSDIKVKPADRPLFFMVSIGKDGYELIGVGA